MARTDLSRIGDYVRQSTEVYLAIESNRALLERIDAAARVVTECLANGGKVFFCGNGGSAADAQHLAGELVSRFNYDRPGMASIALTTDSSILTSIGNDYGYEKLFSRQIEALGRNGDVLVGISTSGKSPNVIEGLKAARRLGLTTIGFTGRDGGTMAELCDVEIRMPSQSTPLIQQGHIMVGHIICACAEEDIYPRKP
jgi:D-sedoheptulose 7-phosphate isomerase